MGLMYPFPISKEESDFVIIDDENSTTTIKSYGLPYLFWIYGLAALTVFSFMILGVWGTLMTLLYSADSINNALALSFLLFCGSLPVMLFIFFFYQKVITADHVSKKLHVIHKVAGLSFKRSIVQYTQNINLEIKHFLDSPNVARIQGDEQMRGFKNKGYFLLEAIPEDGSKVILIDRSSSKADLAKIKKLLES